MGRRSLGDSCPPVRLPGPFSFLSPSLPCFASPFRAIHPIPSGLALAAAVIDLQEKEAIEPASSSLGYYSCLFVTPKVTGGWQPVIDLSRLNGWVAVSHFHVEMFQSVLQSLRVGDWMVALDLQDAYFQVPVHPSSRRYLRFCMGDSVFLFRHFDGSAGVHTCHGPSLLDNASVQFQDPLLSQRLARPRILVSGDCAGKGLSALALSGAQDSRQPVEELLDSYSVDRLSGDAASDVSFEGFSDPQTCPEALLSRTRPHILSAASSCYLVSTAGGDVLGVRSRSGCLTPHAVPSALAGSRLVDDDLVSWDDSCLSDL